MFKLKLYLDTRRQNADGCPLRLRITKSKATSFYSLGMNINPKEWDKVALRVILSPRRKMLNEMIDSRVFQVRELCYAAERVNPNVTAKELLKIVRNYYTSSPSVDVPKYFLGRLTEYADRANKKRTKELYLATKEMILKYCEGAELLTFEQMDVKWMQSFDKFMEERGNCVNARSIHFRNIRAIFNEAITDEITSSYPFRKFKIRAEKTKKRSLTIEAIRAIFNADKLCNYEQRYLDFFKLTFMLIGINVIDLCGLKTVEDDRVKYVRAKTYRNYSIKVEPEAKAILDKYAGGEHLLNFMDDKKSYRSFYGRLQPALESLRKKIIEANSELSIPKLTTYWARHTWSTIALKLGVSREVIRVALGHGDSSVTGIYLDDEVLMEDVDKANRRVLDWVLYDKQ